MKRWAWSLETLADVKKPDWELAEYSGKLVLPCSHPENKWKQWNCLKFFFFFFFCNYEEMWKTQPEISWGVYTTITSYFGKNQNPTFLLKHIIMHAPTYSTTIPNLYSPKTKQQPPKHTCIHTHTHSEYKSGKCTLNCSFNRYVVSMSDLADPNHCNCHHVYARTILCKVSQLGKGWPSLHMRGGTSSGCDQICISQ